MVRSWGGEAPTGGAGGVPYSRDSGGIFKGAPRALASATGGPARLGRMSDVTRLSDAAGTSAVAHCARTMPRFSAMDAAWALSRAPNFARMAFTCALTVPSVILSRSAIA